MPVPTDITAGTISITGTTVTGVGTSFLASDIRQGDLFVWVETGAGRQQPIVQTVNSNTSITLAEPWTGADVPAGSRYRLRYQWDSSRVSAQARQLIELLDGGNLSSIAGLDGTGGDKGVMFNGPGSATTFALTAFARTLLDDANAEDFYATLGEVPNAQIRNDLTPDKAFRRGNIIGTVSVSGGVPTGALFEAGNNYLRLANGFQACWGVGGAGGTGWKSTGINVFFQASFAFDPTVTISGNTPDPGYAGAYEARYVSTTGFLAIAPGGITDVGTSAAFGFMALGRWI